MTAHCKPARRGAIKVADVRRAQFIGEIKNKIKQSLIQQKTWRELLEIDNLTINGIVILKDGQLSRGHHLRHKK
jgi:predicted XRE-type DNA-binding protein